MPGPRYRPSSMMRPASASLAAGVLGFACSLLAASSSAQTPPPLPQLPPWAQLPQLAPIPGMPPLPFPQAPGAVGNPVVVALYTSEMCGACAAGDATLTRLTKTQGVAGANMLTLEFHVDAMDTATGKDPYAKPDFGARQTSYAYQHGSNRIYTPEAIVDGMTDADGADESSVRRLVAQRALVPKLGVNAAWAGLAIGVDVPPTRVKRAAVRVAWVAPSSTLAAPGFRAAEHTNLVRDYATIAEIAPQGGHFTIPAHLDPTLNAVVLVEDLETGALLGARLVPHR
jgi:hypothetical protein